MFLAIVFIVLGLFLLLNAMGIIVSANFWGFFWAVVFLAIGIKLLVKKDKCLMCGLGHNCGHDHNHEGHDHQ
jgi:hypothetical protein